MLQARGYAAHAADQSLQPFDFERRDVGAKDVLIEILFCGICHSDIHQARNEWGNSVYPMVPGHEIVGRVSQTGAEVSKFKAGDFAGVGCLVDSCRTCDSCSHGFEQFCEKQAAFTYNSTEMDRKTQTQGGYASNIVVDEAFALKINASEDRLAAIAPLLCAGITTYSPIRRFDVRHGQNVGVVGLGGLGHMGVKIAAATGAHVTVFSTSPDKEPDARKLGAIDFIVSKDAEQMRRAIGKFDFILDTVSAAHDINAYLALLKRNGKLVLVGAPDKPAQISAFSLLGGNKTLAGSMIGGIEETQEMLDYCSAHNIVSDIEIIPIQDLETAYERTIKGDVRYRFVIDMKTL